MKDKKIGYFIGQTLGAIVLACLCACIGGIAVALTVKFLGFIF